MRKGVDVSKLVRRLQRALVVGVIAVLLGVLAAPETSLALQVHPGAHHPPLVQPKDGSGDSPLVP
jgi:hypothetical protein